MGEPHCREDYVRISNDDQGTWTYCATCPLAALASSSATEPESAGQEVRGG